jgi:hypothetical protein
VSDKAYQTALAQQETLHQKLTDLEEQLEEVWEQIESLEQWIAKWRELAGESASAAEQPQEQPRPEPTTENPPLEEVAPVARPRERPVARPRERTSVRASRTPAPKTLAAAGVIKAAREVLIAEGRPRTRGTLVKALEARGYRVSGKDKERNLGTIMWRARDQFINIERLGYWPKDIPCPKIRYVPGMSPEDASAAAVAAFMADTAAQLFPTEEHVH